MKTRPLMVCGHAANAVNGNGDPSCAICCTSEIDDRMLSREGRMAKCSYSHMRDGTVHPDSLRPSSDPGLAFFEYRGPGSAYAMGTCKHCHYNIVAHDPTVPHMARIEGGGRTRYENFMRQHGQHEFEPIGPAEYDLYYCGCWGWN